MTTECKNVRVETAMKVAVMVSSLSYGGAEKQAVLDANMLSREFPTWLVSFSDGPQRESIGPGVNQLILIKRSYPRTAFALMKVVRQNKIEVIHAFLFASCVIAALSSLLGRVKVVWHFHSHEYDSPLLSRLALIILARLPSLMAITFVSSELRDDLKERFHLPLKKLRIIYNSSSVEPSEHKAENEAKVIVGYVGRLVALKRINYLINLAETLATKNINNFEIWIVGDGEETPQLKLEAQNRGVEKYVKFWGFQHNLSEFYHRFDIFVLPSREECLSIAMIDAGMNAVPSVAFKVGGNDEIVVDGSTGYLVATEKEMIDKTRELVIDAHRRAGFGANARSYCEPRFSAEARKHILMELGRPVDLR